MTEQHTERAERRRATALDRLDQALSSDDVRIPARASSVEAKYGAPRKLGVEAIELARQVYYVQHGSFADCARAIIASGLAGEVRAPDALGIKRVVGWLSGWWRYVGWPKRSTRSALAIRDGTKGDGALFRNDICTYVSDGSYGHLRQGERCGQPALVDSDRCWGHDPRPEHEAKRARTGRRLTEQRERERVPVGPLLAIIDAEAGRLLAEARARGEQVAVRERGRGRAAARMGISRDRVSMLRREGTVLARFAVRYLERAGMKFADVYGFDPPLAGWRRCPGCGERMGNGSKRCMNCHEGARVQCRYLNVAGRRCGRQTGHESGYCHHCRMILKETVARW